jgi:hypothetical protein
MHISQRIITGYDVPDTHEDLRKLNPQEKEVAWKLLRNELKFQAGTYVYRAMKKVGEGGCIFATHQ